MAIYGHKSIPAHKPFFISVLTDKDSPAIDRVKALIVAAKDQVNDPASEGNLRR
jgi:hypothetical protein